MGAVARNLRASVIGALPVASIDTGLVKQVLDPIWNEKPETASRVRSRIENILDWATSSGHRSGDNPARWRGHLKNLLSSHKEVWVKHFIRAALSRDQRVCQRSAPSE